MRTRWFADWRSIRGIECGAAGGRQRKAAATSRTRATFLVNPAAELGRGNFFYRELLDERGVEPRCVVFRFERIFEDMVNGVGVTVDVGDDHLEIVAVGLGSSSGH
jgi:hypothetical protein